jgi:hypothetical protein
MDRVVGGASKQDRAGRNEAWATAAENNWEQAEVGKRWSAATAGATTWPPSFVKRRDRRCRKCFSTRYESAARTKKAEIKK